jgi:hypothetical protein
LNRFGCAHQNPPLAGDILEEFQNGRSAAWYWRQALAVIATGLARNARLFWRPVAASVLIWAVEAGIAFALWRVQEPPRPHNVGLEAVLMAFFGSFLLGISPKISRSVKVRSAKADTVISACVQFILLLLAYCASAWLWNMSLWDVILIQSMWLLKMLENALRPSRIVRS